MFRMRVFYFVNGNRYFYKKKVMVRIVKDTRGDKELLERLAKQVMQKIKSGQIDPFKEKREEAWKSLKRAGVVK